MPASAVQVGDLIALSDIPAAKIPGPMSVQGHPAYHDVIAREVLVEKIHHPAGDGHVHIRWTGTDGPRQDVVPDQAGLTLLPTTTAALRQRLEGYIADQDSAQGEYEDFRKKFPHLTHGFLVPSPEFLAELDRRIIFLQTILDVRM